MEKNIEVEDPLPPVFDTPESEEPSLLFFDLHQAEAWLEHRAALPSIRDSDGKVLNNPDSQQLAQDADGVLMAEKYYVERICIAFRTNTPSQPKSMSCPPGPFPEHQAWWDEFQARWKLACCCHHPPLCQMHDVLSEILAWKIVNQAMRVHRSGYLLGMHMEADMSCAGRVNINTRLIHELMPVRSLLLIDSQHTLIPYLVNAPQAFAYERTYIIHRPTAGPHFRTAAPTTGETQRQGSDAVSSTSTKSLPLPTEPTNDRLRGQDKTEFREPANYELGRKSCPQVAWRADEMRGGTTTGREQTVITAAMSGANVQAIPEDQSASQQVTAGPDSAGDVAETSDIEMRSVRDNHEDDDGIGAELADDDPIQATISSPTIEEQNENRFGDFSTGHDPSPSSGGLNYEIDDEEEFNGFPDSPVSRFEQMASKDDSQQGHTALNATIIDRGQPSKPNEKIGINRTRPENAHPEKPYTAEYKAQRKAAKKERKAAEKEERAQNRRRSDATA